MLQLLELLRKTADLSGDFEAALLVVLKTEHYRAHQVIVSQNQPETRLWYIRQGFARGYFYGSDGREHTTRFWRSGDLIFSATGFYPLPSIRYIEITETSELFALTYEHLRQLALRFPEMIALIQHFLRQDSESELERLNLAVLPPRKRYQAFRQSHPFVFRNIPLRFIASYLNITRESLSRIIGRK